MASERSGVRGRGKVQEASAGMATYLSAKSVETTRGETGQPRSTATGDETRDASAVTSAAPAISRPGQLLAEPPELPRALAQVSAGRRFAIRALDVAFGVLAGAFFLPIALVIAWRIKAHDGHPALFRQNRVGRDGRTFTCYKFRTMRTDAEDVLIDLLEDEAVRMEFESAYKLQDDPRVTEFGAWLRRTGIDELPQLINVLNGTMSLVGPRPLQVDEVARYGELGTVLLAIKPGITGPWQISGRNTIPYEERVRIDAGLAIGLSAGSYLRYVVESGLRFVSGRLHGGV